MIDKYFIELKGISKTFLSNGANALDFADFNLYRSEIHALFGENGAGKSTFMQIISGFTKPDTGKIFVDGIERTFKHPADALSIGIGMLRQNPELPIGLKVWEYASLSIKPFGTNKNGKKYINNICKEWNIEIPLDAVTESLSTADRQRTVILSLLLKNVHCFIFDEATAILNDSDTKKFIALCKLLKERGNAVVIISHKIEETMDIADRITILRKGKTAGVVDGDCPKDKIIKLMFDNINNIDNIDRINNIYLLEKNQINKNTKPMVVNNLTVEEIAFPYLRNISFEFETNICAVTGVHESGIETLEMAVAGLLSVKSGSVFINGKNIAGKGVDVLRLTGGAYLCTGTSLAEGRALRSWDGDLSIADNLLIHCYKKLNKGFFLHPSNVALYIKNIMRKAGLNNSVTQKAYTLSGGMLQRMLIFREFAEDSDVFIMHEIALGLDRNRKEIIFDSIKEAAKSGKYFLLFFSDIDDVLELCNEVIVLCNGEVSLQLHLSDLKNAKEKIRLAMTANDKNINWSKHQLNNIS
ncbi:MAG: ABC transporter ATP-binding protein [Termitinemataceae bacterium]|nr:MAG: ABC transporter ATP-binding protein [Termitinemataceae bacterium]